MRVRTNAKADENGESDNEKGEQRRRQEGDPASYERPVQRIGTRQIQNKIHSYWCFLSS